MSKHYTCYVGSQTDTSSAKGISIFDVDAAAGKLTLRGEIEVSNAVDFAVSSDGRYLYSIADEGVAAFKILPDGGLTHLNTGPIKGLRGCNLFLSPDNRYIFVSGNYDAKITVLSVNPDGSVGRITDGVFHKGLGITERDFIPHVRCARLTPDGRYLCVSDNGLDQIVIYTFDSDTGKLQRLDMISCKLESGPGIMEFSKDGRFLYVMEELVCRISVYRYDGDGQPPVGEKAGEAAPGAKCWPRFTHVQTVSSLGSNHSDKFSGVTLSLTADDSYLLCTNAGNNSLGIFARDAATGELTQKNVLPVSGHYPTDIVLFPDEKHLFVTNVESDTLTFFTINYEQGLIVMNQAPMKVPAPACGMIVAQE